MNVLKAYCEADESIIKLEEADNDCDSSLQPEQHRLDLIMKEEDHEPEEEAKEEPSSNQHEPEGKDIDVNMIKDEFAQAPTTELITPIAENFIETKPAMATPTQSVEKPRGKTTTTRRSLAAPGIIPPKRKSTSTVS